MNNTEKYKTTDHNTFMNQLAMGHYRNIVVFTGAGISTSTGIPCFRGDNGLFTQIRSKFGKQISQVEQDPTFLLSRQCVNSYPEIFKAEVQPWLDQLKKAAHPTPTHVFCGFLHKQGWLRRIYTQNVDGLHSTHVPACKVVECHGSIDKGVVLYGDALPPVVESCLNQDFIKSKVPVDLVLVMGTSLQVAPFCAFPNMAPPGCTRALVNTPIQDCFKNTWSKVHYSPYEMYSESPGITYTVVAKQKVSLRPQWIGTKKKWPTFLFDEKCDNFCTTVKNTLLKVMQDDDQSIGRE